ncbi:MAG: hypothetical protein RLZZ65_953 [Bacteroidota bacterium]
MIIVNCVFMNQLALQHQSFEEIYQAHTTFFKRIIAQYFPSSEQQDVLQEFAIHFYFLFEKKYPADAALFDSKAWLRTVLSHFCVSMLRKKNAQKNAVWVQTTTQAILIASTDQIERETLLIELLHASLGCVNKQEALVLKMKYMYQKSSRDIERILGIQYADVQINRIKAKIRKKLNRTDLTWL